MLYGNKPSGSLPGSAQPQINLNQGSTQVVNTANAFAQSQARQARQHSAFPNINTQSYVNPNSFIAQDLSNWNFSNNTNNINGQGQHLHPQLYHSNSTGHAPLSTMALGMSYHLPRLGISLTHSSLDMEEQTNNTVAGLAESTMDFAAFLTVDDMASAHGFPVSNPGSNTVSPQEVFLDYDGLSAPNSNALTDLTTPSMCDDSPFDVSPVFGTADIESRNWAPLFSNNDMFSSSTLEPLALSTSSLDKADTEMVRTVSGSSITLDNDVLRQRLSVVSGINKSSRRTLKDLPEIEVDDCDDKAVKRARNTMAARKSRQKKRDTEDALRLALDAMTADRDHWRLVAIQHGAPLPKP